VTSPPELKRQISEYSRMIHERGWVANHDGNVSARLFQESRFLITPTGVSKRLCSPDTLVSCDLEGKASGSGKPPSEVALHVGAYKRPDVRAVIHAHPPHASAFALARRPIDPIAMPEVIVSLGDRVPLVPMFLPKDGKVSAAVAEALAGADAAVLAGNGVITVGVDLEQAYLRLELLEHYAHILSLSASIGGPAAIEPEARAKLLEMRQQAGLGPKPAAKAAADKIRPIVAEEVRRVFGGSK
jgi:L-fuculose-phosphate aldolase